MKKQVQNYIINEEWTSTVLEIKNTGCAGLSFKLIKDVNDFDSLKTAWNEVVLRSSSTIFQSFEWLNCWWKYFAAGNQNTLHIILFYLNENLIGIAPCYIQGYELLGFGVFRQLKLLGSGLNTGKSGSNPIEQKGISDYLDVICMQGFEKLVADSLISYITDFNSFFDELDLQNISEDSFIFKWILPHLNEAGFSVKSSRSDVCPILKVPVSMDFYLDMVRSNTRRKLRQVFKQMEAGSLCKIEEVKPQTYASAFQSLKLLHQKRWNGLGYTGMFSDNRFEKFQDEISRQFMENGWLWFKTLKQNNRIIAARLGFKFNNKIYDYLSGFDVSPASASIRPGMVLLILMIKEAIENDFNHVDFLRGSEDYKFEISSSVHYNYRFFIKTNTSTNALRLVLFRLIKLRNSVELRLRSERLIIGIHIKQHGSLAFVPAYLKFYSARMKAFLSRILLRHRRTEQLPKASKPTLEKSSSRIKKRKIKIKDVHKSEIHESELKA